MAKVTFDPRKSALNVTLAGRETLPFDTAADFDFDTAVVRVDTRSHPVTGKPYPEERRLAIGRIGRRTVMLVYTPTPDGFRVISLRPADKKERKLWQDNRSSTTTTPRS